MEDLERSVENLLSLPLDDSELEGYDLDQLRREEAEYDRMFPSLSSYPLFNAAPYGEDLAEKAMQGRRASPMRSPDQQQLRQQSMERRDDSFGQSIMGDITRQGTTKKEVDDFGFGSLEQQPKYDSWLAQKEAMLKKEAGHRFEEEEARKKEEEQAVKMEGEMTHLERQIDRWAGR